MIFSELHVGHFICPRYLILYTTTLFRNTHKLNHKTDSKYQFWQEGTHPKQILSEEIMRQKLDYIHNNPVKRGYVDLPEHWRYSIVLETMQGKKG